ncbi:hypothetical protein MCUN1_003642 [Malassezia cuniculi]|uniref:Uncharacterized protein n=1 Tax=Malassezia cuniculi TaxID=948313 RepID=A0AAF0EXC3_9BASI|nr:hypothetical protein MCUN1_003642 [Malassezia cuniculi]
MQKADPTKPRFGMTPALRLAAFLGAAGGFLLAYQRTSLRFWGWTENEREVALASEEVASGNVPGFGKSQLTDEMQGAAFRNSVNSQLNFGIIPWFNFVNHKYHGQSN